jgi:hypothetical protein
MICMGSSYQYTDVSVVDFLRARNLWAGGFVIFHFLDIIKMNEILPWYFPMVSTKGI